MARGLLYRSTMRPSRTLRRSVITVTAAFALPACSSSHPPESEHDAGTPGCMPPMDCDLGPTNPPEPLGECPVERPSAGTLCDLAEDELCEYDRCGDYWTIEATCRAGQWSVQELSCNPPPLWEECPEVAPADGAPCDAPELSCAYPGCGGETSLKANCIDAEWIVREEVICNPPPVECPEVEPAEGAPCEALTFTCQYGGCAEGDSVIATCGREGWQVDEELCNPPPPEDGGIE